MQKSDAEELAECAATLEQLILGHPEEQILRFFRFNHLGKEELKYMSASFAEMVIGIIATAPRSPERTVAMRKLLESKDAAVRAMLG